MSKRSISKRVLVGQLARRLDGALGPQGWWPAETPFEVMVGAVLTQNTNWANVERAIGHLKAAGALSPAVLSSIRKDRLARLIKPAGYFRVKAGRLQALCRWFVERFDGKTSRAARSPTEALRRELLSVHGVGPETADSILLYALGRPVFVIDAYTRRILSRHGLIGGEEPYEEPYDELRRLFEESLDSVSTLSKEPRRSSSKACDEDRVRLYNELHAQIVAVAKRWCAREPRCGGCPLQNWARKKRRG